MWISLRRAIRPLIGASLVASSLLAASVAPAAAATPSPSPLCDELNDPSHDVVGTGESINGDMAAGEWVNISGWGEGSTTFNAGFGFSGNTYPRGSTAAFGTISDSNRQVTWSSTTPFGWTVSCIPVPQDVTAPSISGSQSPTPNANGWNNSDVTVSFDCSDASGILSCTPPELITSEGSGQAVTGTAFDNNGNSSTAVVEVNLDKTDPGLGTCPLGGPFVLGSGLQVVGPISAEDGALSGIDEGASTLEGSVDTSTVGTKDVTFSAVDLAGNTASQNCTYDVEYAFSGFFQPVDNAPVVNYVKAGASIPVKFSLGDDAGLNVFAPGYPTVELVDCTSGPTDIIETTTAGNSSLSYDPLTNTYTYVWKTQKAWSGKCGQFQATLSDGTTHVAEFGFTK